MSILSTIRFLLVRVLAVGSLLTVLSSPAFGLTQEQALAMATGSNSKRVAAINEAVVSGADRLAPYFNALMRKRVVVADDRALIKRGETAIDPTTGETVDLPETFKKVRINNRLRRTLKDALAGLRLFSKESSVRRDAAEAMARTPSKATIALFRTALQTEKDPVVLATIRLAVARSQVTDPDKSVRLEAANQLAASDSLTVRQLLRNRLIDDGSGDIETDAEVRYALNKAYAAVEHRIFMAEIGGTMFAGISLGSVLLLAALGLAITYGLMGVINLAHGELMMIGAYATYLAQEFFRSYLSPAWFDGYLLLAIPLSFLVAALVGALLERFVIRYLYGRELETLLATWGISLILMQAVRNLFGAQNVSVENPSWMSGGIQLAENLVLPYNRIAIIVFAFLVLAIVGLIIARTRLGLFVRATIQNRTMARCVGVPTARTDMMAFALGSGVAGLAGCALSQIGNVGPDLGQGYIVDSFLVVVVGGVGQLAGAVVAAMGLGIFSKILEGMSGAVIAKIMLLVAVIIFIQRRPQGIFALRGRSA